MTTASHLSEGNPSAPVRSRTSARRRRPPRVSGRRPTALRSGRTRSIARPCRSGARRRREARHRVEVQPRPSSAETARTCSGRPSTGARQSPVRSDRWRPTRICRTWPWRSSSSARAVLVDGQCDAIPCHRPREQRRVMHRQQGRGSWMVIQFAVEPGQAVEVQIAPVAPGESWCRARPGGRGRDPWHSAPVRYRWLPARTDD